MNSQALYTLCGLLLFLMGIFSICLCSHSLRKILAFNVASSGVFLVFIATAYRPQEMGPIDPVPHAMVLTGIVVSVSVTALALVLACRMQETSNRFRKTLKK